ncbi:MAG: beta-ketoacyl-[acyl-carrier-protein] synthase family protein [Candidatus Omnitrophica bacterium]|nr:beta-ketoacyl-[acyl-carrier-protein] synthase family protein [Candidatus Omnitrophota bacterium]MBU2044629.1 beta-ketoacyl-[acyl-carrier-protein] synthase family protein [Candidatus Omnitrophota bacterium]MBU2250930.1 beta-ketoacyl-[acyl-carrier-protein] synthase family protein [Candidatus Omnitrophota bacterium]MBU2474007.1 beta-ketoacyl-[acyl-carrier-protein] synthase family protein [Candidatus Omnitrophota bacterium]
MDKKIVITGVGVLAPNAIGKDNFWQALKEGKSGIKPITIFNPGLFKSQKAGEISDFKAEEFLGPKGLQNVDRATKLVCSAAKLALEDSELQITERNTDSIGVVTGTTLSLWNVAELSREMVEDGPQFVTAGIFPGTTINSASSQISIRHKIKGFNTTISTGYTASLDALKYAVNFIKLGRAKAVLVAGVEGLTFAGFTGFYKIGFLAGIKGEEISCPFDKRRNGIILSEAAVVLVVEDAEYAKARGARVYAELTAVENSFDAFRAAKYEPQAAGLKRTMVKALKSSGLHQEDIDCVFSAANSVVQQDILETKAIREVFNIYADKTPVTAIKSMVGESFSASGILQLAAALGCFEKNFIPPTINYQEKDSSCDLDYVPNQSREQELNNIMINNFGPGGNNATVVVKNHGGE